MAEIEKALDNNNGVVEDLECLKGWKPYEGPGGLPGWYAGIVPPDLEEIPKDEELFFCGVDMTVRTYREIIDGIAEDCRPETLSQVNELIFFLEGERLS